MERKIGEIINYKEVKLKVIKGDGYCTNCFFNYLGHCLKPENLGECEGCKDKPDVIFKEIKENPLIREKEIYKAGVEKSHMQCIGPAVFVDGFIEGAKWAEENPKLHWISVTDSLPKQDEEVIVLCDELNTAPVYKISFGHIVDKTICKDYNGWNIPNVVYWFPMPKLP